MSKNPTFYDTMVSSPQWKAWYEEIMRRHLINEKGGEWKDNKTFDIDESQECGWLGDEHFQEFIKFCCATQQAQMGEETEVKLVAELHAIANGYKTVSGDDYSGGFQDGLIYAITINNPEWSPVVGENKTDSAVLAITEGEE